MATLTPYRGIRGFVALVLALAGCGHDPVGLVEGGEMELVVEHLPAIDPATEGGYQVWIYDAAGGVHTVGRLEGSDVSATTVRMPFVLPVDSPASAAITLEPAGDDDAGPSPHEIVAGPFVDGAAELSIDGSITVYGPLVEEPGAHSLFTSSNNALFGYPSAENAGMWLFNIYPSRNPHGSREVHVAPVDRAWLYEGWIVYRHGTPDAVWISYGKFHPDQRGLLTSRDNTGSGPFSGDEDYRNGGVEEVPGDEWTMNIFELDMPGGLELPLALDAVDPATGEAVWTHVISIEPAFDELEPLYSGRPFLRPYRNPIGEGGPQVPRYIQLRGDMPTAVIRRVTG